MATSPTPVRSTAALSNNERFMHALRRFEAVRTRPTTLAADEFFSKENEREGWKSLPRRLQRLCQILQDWVRQTKDIEIGERDLIILWFCYCSESRKQ